MLSSNTEMRSAGKMHKHLIAVQLKYRNHWYYENRFKILSIGTQVYIHIQYILLTEWKKHRETNFSYLNNMG